MAAVMERFVRIFCLSGFRNKLFCQQLKQPSGLIPVRHYSDKIIDPPYLGPSTPNYKPRVNEPLELKRSRLLYQSRKRGMLENGLLLSTFANKHLDDLNEELLDLYDKVINQPSNDWDLYYWMTEYRPTPEEYDNDVMDMLKKHAKNEQQDVRIRQPDLKEKERQ